MQKIQLKVIFRSWLKNKFCFLIALLSLVVGLSCSVLLIGFVMNESHIAHSVSSAEQLYLLQEQDRWHPEDDLKTNNSSLNIAMELKNSYPEVKGLCIFHQEQGDLYIQDKKEFIQFFSVTPNYAGLFRPTMLTGNLEHTLASPGEVAVSRSFALQHFGRVSPVGESIRLKYRKMMQGEAWKTADADVLLTITAVVDDSEAGVLQYDLLIGLLQEELELKGGSINQYYNFVLLDENTDAAAFIQKVNQDTAFFRGRNYKIPAIDLKPVSMMYYADKENEAADSLIATRDKGLLYIGWSIALAILFIACFNYVNISMTYMMQRLRVTGQQIVFGAERDDLLWALLAETGMQVGLAFLVALGVIYGILPVFNSFVGSALTMKSLLRAETMGVILLLLTAVTILPSLYIYSRLRRVSLSVILKQEYQQRSGLINGMVIAQFAISLVLMIMMLNVRQQMKYITHVRPDAGRIYVLSLLEDSDRWNVFEERVREIPGIEAITASTPLIAGSVSSNKQNMMMAYVDEAYYDFYKLHFIAGRPPVHTAETSPSFSPGVQTDVVVNETLIRRFNITEPLGYELNFNGNYRIVGVVPDVQLDNFSKTIQPLVLIPYKQGGSISLKLPEGNSKEILEKVKQVWREVEPLQVDMECKSLAQLYEELHENEQRLLEIVSFFTWVSLLLTCMGLFGLAWFSVEKRRKEIGVRKINGATEMQVILLLCGRFVKWICYAVIVAFPIAFWLADYWMQQFVYRVGVQYWAFGMAAGVVVLLGIMMVIRQSWKAAIVNPVEVIKSE